MLPFYHPSTILVVDDDATFLESFGYRYKNDFRCNLQESPERAISELKSALSLWQLDLVEGLSDVAQSGLAGPSDALFKLNIGSLQRWAANVRRSDVVSVVIVDYAMPVMSGIDFCRAIEGLPVKRLLLTGKVGDEMAVKAFNEGLIHQFLVKHDPEITTRLPAEMRRLQSAFFEDAGAPLRPATRTGPTSFLGNPDVAEALKSVMASRGVVEHYASHFPSGILIQNKSGAREFIFLVDDETARAQIETAEASGAPGALIDQLQSGRMTMLFPTSDGFYQPDFAADWKSYVYPVDQSIAGWRFALIGEKPLSAFFSGVAARDQTM